MMIAMCGIDGSGKTTQGKLLYDYYKKMGYKVKFIKQHTEDYYMNNDLKNYLYKEEYRTELVTKRIAVLSANDRVKQYNKTIKSKLDEGHIVIVDRYVYSAYAYSMARGLDLQWLMDINKFVPVPDITICIDVPVIEAQRRIKNRKSLSIEENNKIFLQLVRKNYLSQEWGENKAYFIVNGVGSLLDVHKNILNKVQHYEKSEKYFKHHK